VSAHKRIFKKTVETYMKMLSEKNVFMLSYLVAPVEIFKVNLPTIEKLTLFALSRYYHAPVSRVPTHEELAEDVGCSIDRIADALQTIGDHFEGEYLCSASPLH
jgi:hypothetical protein